MRECEDVGQHLLGERTQFDVAFLGSPPQQVERGVGAYAVDVHQHAFCLFDAGSVFGDFAQGLADAFLPRFFGWGDVEVEALRSDHFAGVVVVQPFTDDDDVAGFALDGDDAVAGTQRFVTAADVVERCGDLVVIVWVFVRQHHCVVGVTVPGW